MVKMVKRSLLLVVFRNTISEKINYFFHTINYRTQIQITSLLLIKIDLGVNNQWLKCSLLVLRLQRSIGSHYYSCRIPSQQFSLYRTKGQNDLFFKNVCGVWNVDSKLVYLKHIKCNKIVNNSYKNIKN